MRAEKQDDERPAPDNIADSVKDLHRKDLSIWIKKVVRPARVEGFSIAGIVFRFSETVNFVEYDGRSTEYGEEAVV